jgi:predicted nucleotidyltransferase
MSGEKRQRLGGAAAGIGMECAHARPFWHKTRGSWTATTGGLLPLRLARCDAIVFLDVPRRICLRPVLERRFNPIDASESQDGLGASDRIRPVTSESLKEVIRNAVASQPQIRQAILFGSLAADAQQRDSDLDLAVAAGRPLTADEKFTLISDLSVAIGRPVDLVDLHTVGEPLLGQILRHGTRLLGSDSDYAALIRRHVFDRADFSPLRDRILAERRRAWIDR